jgi:hypothetical protein
MFTPVLKRYALLLVSLNAISIFSQTPFTKYFCETDTQFNGKAKLAKQSLVKSNLFGSSKSGFSHSAPNGMVKGMAMNRTSNFKYFEGASNLKSFNTANIITTHTKDSLGTIYSTFGKSTITFDIAKDAKLDAFVTLPFAADLLPKPITLNKVVLGVTNFQTTNNRGNFFAIEDFYLDNSQIKSLNRDTFGINNSFSGFETYPSDNANYSNILGKLNSAEYTGWIIELDRLDNEYQKRRFDLGRAPRKAIIVQSERTQTPASMARITQTYQVLGGNDFNVIVRTLLNNNVQEFYVYYEEENAAGSHWSLLNQVSGGKIQPLSAEVLKDVYKYIVTSPDLEFSYFMNVTDIKLNETANSVVIVTPGGTANLADFTTRFGITTTPVLMTYLTPLQAGNVVTDKFGHFIELNGEFVAANYKCGFTNGTSKFFSNPSTISFVNISYIDEESDPKNTSYAIVSEEVWDNSLNQNPSSKKGIAEFQNEVYLFDLKGLSASSSVVDFPKQPFELFAVLENNTTCLQGYYTETYMPWINVTVNKNSGMDSLNVVRGFGDFFIAPESCSVSTDAIEDAVVLNKVVLYPNPIDCKTGNCEFHINTVDNISIYSMQGQLLKSLKQTNVFDISTLPEGVFVVKGEKGWSELIIKN